MELLRKALLACAAAARVPTTRVTTVSRRIRGDTELPIANRANPGHDKEIDGEACGGGEGKSGTIPGTFPKAVLRQMLDMSPFLVARKWNPCMLGRAVRSGGVASRLYSDDEISLMLVCKSWKAAVESCSTMKLRRRHRDLYGKMRKLQREIHMWSYLAEWVQDPAADPSPLLGFEGTTLKRRCTGAPQTTDMWRDPLDRLIEQQVIRYHKLSEDHLEKRKSVYEHLQRMLAQLKASPLAENAPIVALDRADSQCGVDQTALRALGRKNFCRDFNCRLCGSLKEYVRKQVVDWNAADSGAGKADLEKATKTVALRAWRPT